jgi:hypothetical protein
VASNSVSAISDPFSRVTGVRRKKLKPSLKHRNVSSLPWMGARAVDWARLESVCTARYRGFESLPIRLRAKDQLIGPAFRSWEAERALHTFRLIKYVAVHEKATVYVVPRTARCGRGIGFKFLYEPGGRWSGRGRTERSAILRRLLTAFDGFRNNLRRKFEDRVNDDQTADPVLSNRWPCLASNEKPTASAYR